MRSQEEILKSELIWGRKGSSGYIKLPDCGTCSVIWSIENGMEHVSVCARKKFDKLGRENLPTWNDMCFLKDLFFDDEEEVYQIHPKKSEYVNLMSRCLHLWKPGKELDKYARYIDKSWEEK